MDSKAQSALSKVVDIIFLLVIGGLVYAKRIPDTWGLGLFALFQSNRGAIGAVNKLLTSGLPTVPPSTPPGGSATGDLVPESKKPEEQDNNLPRMITSDAVRSSTVLFSLVSLIEGAYSIGHTMLKQRVAVAAACLCLFGFLIKG